MSPVTARSVAHEALQEWSATRFFADTILHRLEALRPLSSRDRAFAQELFYGVLRNLSLLDFWLGVLRQGHLQPGVRTLLRLGLYQAMILRIAPHAAVNEVVALAPARARPVVNGVLRTALRREEELREMARAQPPEIRFSHPAFLLERWRKAFGPEETEALCRWNNEPPPVYARINLLQTDKPGMEDPTKTEVPGAPGFFRLEAPPAPGIADGSLAIQDPSTALACRLLDPQPGEHVLDACAAPGGKTALLAELMQNRGSVEACDRDPSRLRLLEENMDRLGVRCVRTRGFDWLEDSIPTEWASRPFDRILLDAPCTNTGVMRRRVDLRWRLRPADFKRMAGDQARIAHRLVPLLRDGGWLAYSTCSMEHEENEGVVEQLLATSPGLALVRQERTLPFRDGIDGAFVALFRAGA